MHKPNFWRLKRKAKANEKPSVHNPPKISQLTIASFFGSARAAPSTSVEDADLHSSLYSKKAKIEDNSQDAAIHEKSVALANSTLDKLKSFSASVKNPDKADCTLLDSQTVSECLQDKSRYREIREEDMITGLNGQHQNTLDSFKATKHTLKSINTGLGLSKPVGKVKYTPLEQQVIDMWKQHPGVLLFIECGYKYRFFGKDAEIAAQELNIFAHLDHNFLTASIPVHRLHAHISRLVEKGYKVGVVKQTEVASLKAVSGTKNAPFARKLEQIYTRATLIGEELQSNCSNVQLGEDLQSGCIMCVNESSIDQKSVSIGIVAVNPSTGECVYDTFEDNIIREEFYKRLQIINPAEILAPSVISINTERLLNHCDARLERLSSEYFEETNAMTRIVSHFAFENGSKLDSDVLEVLMDSPALVLTCLAAIQHHLSEFGLQRAIRLNGIERLSSGPKFMYLDSSTIRNLQLFTSDSGSNHGSLFWALNHTKTSFGARLLRKWLSEPSRDLEVLEARQEAINELINADQMFTSQLITFFCTLPDIDKGLTTILHNKCNPMHYLNTLEALCRIHTELSSLLVFVKQDFRVPLLQNLVISTVDLLQNVQVYKDNINVQAAKDGDKTKLLKDFSAFPCVLKLMEAIVAVTRSLDELRPDIARKLSLLSINYCSVSGQNYLIEVKNTNAKYVPSNWRKISCTKQVGRYRPPAVDSLHGELQRLQDKLRVECHSAWLGLLQEFSSHYYNHIKAVHNIATLDVLLSLAYVAQQEGFCRPKLVSSEDAHVIIKQGRHPIVPLLLGGANQFVPNDTNLDNSGECCMVLSGPNMGGKSCYIRQVALITLLAHIGSFVPADSAEISILESIFTRMGARDELFEGRSTLMVELEETASILQRVSRHSLVLLDELGRGTSSCDGSAIACATLHYIALEAQCLTLFVTHYPVVMSMVSCLEGKAGNYHMAFLLHQQDQEEILTFLYEVVRGAADRSYGINVARLANLHKQLLERAATVAADLEKQTTARRDIRQSFVKHWHSNPQSTVVDGNGTNMLS